MRTREIVFVALGVLFAGGARAADRSGPQVGDALPGFKMRGVFDDEAGKQIDVVADAAGKPVVLFFLHERTRPSVALAREVLNQAADRKGDGLFAGLVLLTDDVAKTEEWLRIAVQSLPRGVPIGVSLEGETGPAAYNLNRQVQATVIVARDNRVTANFALTMPSRDDDAPKIVAAVEKALAAGKP